MSIKNTLGEFAAIWGGGKLLDKGIEKFTEKTVEAATQRIQSKFFGIGESDEVLTLSAATYAVTEYGVFWWDIKRIFKVLAEYPISVRNKITNIIGDQEQKVSETTIKKYEWEKKEEGYDQEQSGRKNKNKKGQGRKNGETITSKTEMANIKGAKVFLMFSKMSDDEIRAILKGSGSLDTLGARLGESMENLGKRILFVVNNIEPETISKTKAWIDKKFEQKKKEYENLKRRRTG